VKSIFHEILSKEICRLRTQIVIFIKQEKEPLQGPLPKEIDTASEFHPQIRIPKEAVRGSLISLKDDFDGLDSLSSYEKRETLGNFRA